MLPNTGTHRVNGQDYKGGDVIESDRDLTALFPQKFELVETLAEVTAKDVTDTFPAAGENGLQVQQRGGWYYLLRDGLEVSGALRSAAVEDAVYDWIENNAD
jgi:hypothetical protein